MPPRFDGYDRVAIVTGAESGIGKATALALASDGFDVAITWHRDENDAQAVAERVRALGRRAEVSHLELADPPAAGAVIDELAERMGGLGVLVNNAAGLSEGPALEIEYPQWRRLLTTNLDGPFVCAQHAARHMVHTGRGGRIVTVTSVHEHHPRVGTAAYTAAKGGLGMAMKVLALELAEHGVTVNCVAPGAIATPMSGQDGADVYAIERPGIPAGRPGEPDEVAAVVALLASPRASYVTGSSWGVDGGMALMGPDAGRQDAMRWRVSEVAGH